MSLEDLDARVRVIERQLAERAYLMDECTTLRERVGKIEVELHPLLALTAQLTSLSSQLTDLKTDLAHLKGRALGIVAVVTLLAPLIASVATGLFMKALK